MKAKEAVAQRIVDLCREYDLTITKLAILADIPPSTIYSMLNEKSQNPGIVSLQRICGGLKISLHTFFDSPLFDEVIDPYED